MTRLSSKYLDASTWPTLPQALETVTINKANANYYHVRSNYSRVGHPELVIMADNEQKVSDTIKYVKEVRETTQERIPFSFRSGGSWFNDCIG